MFLMVGTTEFFPWCPSPFIMICTYHEVLQACSGYVKKILAKLLALEAVLLEKRKTLIHKVYQSFQ